MPSTRLLNVTSFRVPRSSVATIDFTDVFSADYSAYEIFGTSIGSVSGDNLLKMAIALFGVGKIEESFDMLLKSIEIDKEWNEKAARKQLLEFFSSAGIEAKETINARKKLATLLFS